MTGSDIIVALGGLLMLAGSYAVIRWAPHARDLAFAIWDAVSTRPADKEMTR